MVLFLSMIEFVIRLSDTNSSESVSLLVATITLKKCERFRDCMITDILRRNVYDSWVCLEVWTIVTFWWYLSCWREMLTTIEFVEWNTSCVSIWVFRHGLKTPGVICLETAWTCLSNISRIRVFFQHMSGRNARPHISMYVPCVCSWSR